MPLSGEIVYLFAFDVGQEVLTAAVGLRFTRSGEPLAPRRRKTVPTDAVLYRPLTANPSAESVLVSGTQASADVRVYDAGVIAVSARFPFAVESLAELRDFHTPPQRPGNRSPRPHGGHVSGCGTGSWATPSAGRPRARGRKRTRRSSSPIWGRAGCGAVGRQVLSGSGRATGRPGRGDGERVAPSRHPPPAVFTGAERLVRVVSPQGNLRHVRHTAGSSQIRVPR